MLLRNKTGAGWTDPTISSFSRSIAVALPNKSERLFCALWLENNATSHE
jgi:hypothetical protein